MYDSIHVRRQTFCRWQDGRNVMVQILDNQMFTVAFVRNFLITINNSTTVKETYSAFL